MTPEDITLEERVAALEALLLPREPGWTDEQVAEFKDEWERHLSEGPLAVRKYEPARLLPPAPVLTPETARALLSECVTVVSPGETLVIRASDNWTPRDVEYYQEFADAATASGRISFPVLVVIGDELAVARPEPAGQSRSATGKVHVTVPVTPVPASKAVFTDPQYQRELQRAIQEATVRHAGMNPGDGGGLGSPLWRTARTGRRTAASSRPTRRRSRNSCGRASAAGAAPRTWTVTRTPPARRLSAR